MKGCINHMAFWEKMGETLTVKGKDVADKARELAEVNRLNTQISVQKKKIENLYKEIGQLIYENREDWKSADVSAQIEQIDSAQKSIEGLQKDILRVKGVRKCENCGAEIDRNMVFCPKCGTAMAVDESKQEGEEQEIRAEQTVFLCTGCNKEIDADSAFCPFCGIQL